MTKDSRLTKTIVASYPRGVEATKGSEQFRNAHPYVLITYELSGKQDIPGPTKGKKKRVYPSVLSELKAHSSLGAKKASFAVLESRGGLEGISNASEVPSRKQA